MQQQPALDTPAGEQHPLVERVVETTRSVGSNEKSNVFFATLASYICSVGIAALVAFIFDRAFGLPRHIEEARSLPGEWKLGVAAALTTGFLLGLLFPLLFARSKRPLAVLLTIMLQFMTLVALIIIGLSQLPSAPLS